MTSIPYSVLDLCPVVEGGSAADTFRDTVDLARHAERWGYQRYWLAEHHNMPGIASAATAVVIGHVAAGTTTIRVGAGGVMLPNHSPLVIAEQFGTLESLYPGRIDLGLGRAPGTDGITARAMRRDLATAGQQFPQDVIELRRYLGQATAQQSVRAVPGHGLDVPVWILGSSTFGAQLAAQLGLPYAFASHFAPAQLMDALALYRATFRPSNRWPRPHVMLGFNVFAAETDAEGERLATSAQQAFLNLRRGRPGRLPPPVAGFADTLGAAERAVLANLLSCSAIGSPETVRQALLEFAARTGADELMVAGQIFDPVARRRSYEIAASVCREPVAG